MGIKQTIKLRYQGQTDLCGKQWIVVSTFLDENGYDRKNGNFGIDGLRRLGVIKAVR